MKDKNKNKINLKLKNIIIQHESKRSVKNKKTLLMVLILIFIIISLLITISKINKKDYITQKIGNNKSIKEIEKTILNINSYKAEIEVTIKSNKNENKYKLYQEVKDGREIQKVIEPETLNGMEIIYENGNLQIKNTEINASKIYKNYPCIADNTLFLTDFLKSFKESENKEIQMENDKIIFKLKNGKPYNEVQTLTIENRSKNGNSNDNDNNNTQKNNKENIQKDNQKNNKENIQKDNQENNKESENKNTTSQITMQIYDSNNNIRIYIIYNKIEFNI